MPPIPPSTNSVPAQGCCQSADAASAVGMPLAARDGAFKPRPTAKATSTYQITAQATDITKRRPIVLGGKSISSADCGITSKPTSSAGTIIRTAMMPVAGSAMNGLALSISPNTMAPEIRSRPETKITAVTIDCSTATVRMPMTLIQVTRAAAPEPTSTKPKSTSLSRKVHNLPMRILGNRYSTAVGRAIASNKQTLTYENSSAQVHAKDHRGPKARNV